MICCKTTESYQESWDLRSQGIGEKKPTTLPEMFSMSNICAVLFSFEMFSNLQIAQEAEKLNWKKQRLSAELLEVSGGQGDKPGVQAHQVFQNIRDQEPKNSAVKRNKPGFLHWGPPLKQLTSHKQCGAERMFHIDERASTPRKYVLNMRHLQTQLQNM